MASEFIYRRNISEIELLTKKSPMVESYVPGLNDITLMIHQRTVVYAMLELENTRKVVIRGNANARNAPLYYQTSSMVLSEPFGTGKTYEIIAMILLRPIPRAMPEIIKMSRGNAVTTVMKLYTADNALIRPNLIIVGSSVLNQWNDIINTKTNLKMFLLSDCHAARRLSDIIKNNKINNYDVVLAKNGFISAPFDGMAKEYNSIIAVINHFTGNKCWSRVFYDDFDTIRIPPDAYAINTLFTVYVSATVKCNSVTTIDHKYDDVTGFIESMARITLNNVSRDNEFMHAFNVRNSKKFVEKSTLVPKINQYKYVYKNPDDNFIRLIGAMGDNNTNMLIEMLNGDAINTAADTVGIKTKSIADIFQRVLDNKYDNYITASALVSTIATINLEVLPLLHHHPKGKEHSQAKLQKIRSCINKSSPTGTLLDTMRYTSNALHEMINTISIEAKMQLDEAGKAINRVIDNAKEGMCQICCMELGVIDTFIMKCCGIILCANCGVHGTGLKKGYDRKTNQNGVVGNCANCRASIKLERDFIFLNKNFSIESLMKAKGTETEIIPDVVVEEKVIDPDEIQHPKLNALYKIITGDIAPNRDVCRIKIDRLLDGSVDIPPTGNKVVIFASFNETLQIIEDFLCEKGIDYLRLRGNHNEMANTIKLFKDNINVLLINSSQQCAGINLEFCNHIILFHHITDRNVIGQVVARGQRLKRTSNLQLHFLQYTNEEYLTTMG